MPHPRVCAKFVKTSLKISAEFTIYRRPFSTGQELTPVRVSIIFLPNGKFPGETGPSQGDSIFPQPFSPPFFLKFPG